MGSLFAAYHRIMLGETLLKGVITNTGRVVDILLVKSNGSQKHWL